jgi:superfamily II DNA or RNA helicase
MLNLKTYQKRAIKELEGYLDLIKTTPNKAHKIAFITLKDKIYNEIGLNVPFVCIKIPTGGGKTIVATHMVNSIYEKFTQSKNLKGLVLWLVPTTTIKTQTINALKDRNSSYREILDKKFSNEIIIMDVKDARSIKKSDIENNLCVIVSTTSAFKSESNENRKVLQDSGQLIEHFKEISNEVEKNLEKYQKGGIIKSLMNVIKMSNPIIMADEGHHMKTELTEEMFQKMNPSIIVEFTATPLPGSKSNVLVDVGVGELMDENMIKMPIYLFNSGHWKKTIDEGVAKRKELEEITKKEKGEYIRPIALIQAEQVKPDDKKIYARKIAQYLIEEHEILPNQIAINTGDENIVLDGSKNMTELGNGIFKKDCEIRYIITKDKLKEGWDNKFAYVLITVANLSAKISVEQIIGRIMRLPNAKQKKNKELNEAFVYTSSTNFQEAAESLRSGLILNGFTEEEAGNIIVTPGQSSNPSQFKKVNEDKDIKIPYFGIKDQKRKLEFYEDLVMNSFDLTKQKISEIIIHNDNDRTAKIDVKDNKIVQEPQTKLNLIYDEKLFTKDEVLKWLDRNLERKNQYSQAEKRQYLESVIDNYVKKKDNNLAELWIGRHKVIETVSNHITGLEESTAKTEFEQMSKSKKIVLNEVFLDLPEKIIINNTCSDEFDKHLYVKAGILNSEELELARKIDRLDNILWWYRNPVNDEALFLQGWNKNKFYPDFIIKTKNGNYILTEYKGEHLLTNDDTQYKKALGKKWEEMTPSNYTFELVEKDEIDKFIIKLEKL